MARHDSTQSSRGYDPVIRGRTVSQRKSNSWRTVPGETKIVLVYISSHSLTNKPPSASIQPLQISPEGATPGEFMRPRLIFLMKQVIYSRNEIARLSLKLGLVQSGSMVILLCKSGSAASLVLPPRDMCTVYPAKVAATSFKAS